MSDAATSRDAFRQRLDAVRDRVDIAGVISRVVKLGRGAKPRGKCPFHGSKSDSFAVDPANGRARCWGCDWTGDAIKFVQEYYGLSFVEALRQLEGDHGLDGLTPAPARRAKVERVRPDRPSVDSVVMGRFIWRKARPDHQAVRTYLRARGVPEAMLGDARLEDLRFLATAPIAAWREGGSPKNVPSAPAIVALVRRAPSWAAIGVHVTYLAPDLAGKMERARADGSAMPARKMLGPVGGGVVLLGRYAEDVPLFVGEGIETVLSGMAIAGATEAACGMATLSLDNLQGHAALIRQALPLYDIQPDAQRSAAVAFPHRGLVTGLIDADMKELPGPRDPRTGRPRGIALIEQRGGPIVRRTVTTAERADICAALFVHAWRGCGCRARAVRPRMGFDFNDAAREGL